MIDSEKAFLKKMSLPNPTMCPNCRHAERIKFRNPSKLYDRKCAKCGADIKTSFAPRLPAPDAAGNGGQADRPEIIYCEKCYDNEVV